jgi:hypothetical protein
MTPDSKILSAALLLAVAAIMLAIACFIAPDPIVKLLVACGGLAISVAGLRLIRD